MKYLIYICLCIFASSCTRTITVDNLGVNQTITLKRSEVLQEYIKVEESSSGENYQTSRSCETPGVCCKCGLTMHMEHECSCGMWRNCPGKQNITVKPITRIYRHHYTVKLDNVTKELKSPKYQETDTEILSAGSCN